MESLQPPELFLLVPLVLGLGKEQNHLLQTGLGQRVRLDVLVGFEQAADAGNSVFLYVRTWT